MKLNPVPHALVLALGLVAIGIDAHAATPAGTSIVNQATATYIDSTLAARSATSNTVTTVVQQVASLSLSAGTAKNGSANGQVEYPHTITNNGNGVDSFTLGTTNTGAFTMANVAFYADANGDGIADNATASTTTGPLQPGQSVQVVARVTAFIEKEPAKQGSDVKAGETLFELQKTQYQAAVQAAQAAAQAGGLQHQHAAFGHGEQAGVGDAAGHLVGNAAAFAQQEGGVALARQHPAVGAGKGGIGHQHAAAALVGQGLVPAGGLGGRGAQAGQQGGGGPERGGLGRTRQMVHGTAS